jgi:hypothetical protein
MKIYNGLQAVLLIGSLSNLSGLSSLRRALGSSRNGLPRASVSSNLEVPSNSYTTLRVLQ